MDKSATVPVFSHIISVEFAHASVPTRSAAMGASESCRHPLGATEQRSEHRLSLLGHRSVYCDFELAP